jgi:hypothetical protein
VKLPRPKGRGFCLTAVFRRPGKDLSLFNIAPLDPVLKDGVCGEHDGQNLKTEITGKGKHKI